MARGDVTVGVVGAGSLGCLYGVLLDQAHGVVPTVVSRRSEAAAAIEEHGVRVRATWDDDRELVGHPRVARADDPHLQGAFDLVLLFNKSLTQSWAVELGQRLVRRDGILASMQNGLAPARAVERGSDRGVAGTTYQGATSTSPCTVEWTALGPTLLAPSPALAGRAAELAAQIGSPDLRFEITADRDAMLWKKAVLAIINPVCAATGFSVADLGRSASGWDLVSRARNEVLDVARACGVLFDEEELEAAFRFQKSAAEDGTLGSTYQSLLAGRPTEGADTAASVVGAAKEVGVPSPVCELLEIMSRARDEFLTQRQT